LWGRKTTLSYLIKPETDNAGALIKRNPNATETVLLENALLFVPASAPAPDPTIVASITVTNAVGGRLSLEKGSSYGLNIVVLPATALNKAVSYTSGNPNVATVSAAGEIAAVAAGTTTITIAALDESNVTATVAVTVTEPHTGPDYSKPTYSTAGNEVWYYIQFVKTGFVVQFNGKNVITTTENKVDGQANQLWKFEATGNVFSRNGITGDEVKIISKADPTLRLLYASGSPSAWYGTDANGSYGEACLLPNSYDNSGISCSTLWGHTGSTWGYLIKPETDNAGALIKRNPNGTETVLLENALLFIPEKDDTGISSPDAGKSVLKAYQTENGVLTVVLPEGATQIAVVNLTGQTVKQVKASASTIQEIGIADLISGIYILTVKTTHGVESVKFIVK
jgi:hypothetical protein